MCSSEQINADISFLLYFQSRARQRVGGIRPVVIGLDSDEALASRDGHLLVKEVHRHAEAVEHRFVVAFDEGDTHRSMHQLRHLVGKRP